MRIGLVIYGSQDYTSGGFLYDRMLVAALRRAGDDVQIISLPWEDYGRCVAHNVQRGTRLKLTFSGAPDVSDEVALTVNPQRFFDHYFSFFSK